MWSSTLYQVKKVKVTHVQALRPCTGRTAHRGSRSIALPFHDHGTRRGWGVSVTPWPLFTPGKDPVPIVQEAEWAPGLVWTCAENLATTGIRSPNRPARSSVAIPTELPGTHEDRGKPEIMLKFGNVKRQNQLKHGSFFRGRPVWVVADFIFLLFNIITCLSSYCYIFDPVFFF